MSCETVSAENAPINIPFGVLIYSSVILLLRDYVV
jgi:hypothetical protein